MVTHLIFIKKFKNNLIIIIIGKNFELNLVPFPDGCNWLGQAKKGFECYLKISTIKHFIVVLYPYLILASDNHIHPL